MRRIDRRLPGRGRAGITLVLATLAVAGCAESTAPAYQPPAPYHAPKRTPEPAVGTFHVVLTTTGANPDPDGYQLIMDDTMTQRVHSNDTIAVSNVVLGGHTLRLSDVATNCAPESTSSFSLFLMSARDTVAQLAVACVGPSIPPELAGLPLLFVRRGEIYRTTIGDGAATVPLAAGEEPAWSPDGHAVAFLRDRDVYVMDASGENERLIATTIPEPDWPANDWDLTPILIDAGRRAAAWSPDGTRLAMHSDSTIVIAPVNAAAPIHLGGYQPSTIGQLLGSPTWSPDGKHVAFVSDSWTETLDVFVGDVNGSGLSNIRKLTAAYAGTASHSGTMYVQPAWSPDGKQIAMVACAQPVDYAEAPCAASRIVVINADGSSPRTLASSSGFAKPAWSSDGQFLTFANTCADYDCPSAILYVSADGSRAGMLLDDAHSPSLLR